MTASMLPRPKVIIAVRVSSDDQKERGFGHANQLRRLPELVRHQGWELAKRPDGTPAIYDEGAASTSGDTGDDGLGLASRPVLAELVRELEAVRPTYLVCRKLDRLHRNNLQWEYLQHRLLRAEVEAVVQFPSLVGHPELRRIGSPRERAWASMEATWASLEKEELKEKLMAGRRERASQGLPNGGRAPYGYFRPVKKGPLAVLADEAAVYLRMIEWTLAGHGAAWIANRLNVEGVPTRSGTPSWTATTVRRVVASEAQTGMVRIRAGGSPAWVPAIGQPAIVDRARCEDAQQALSGRRRGANGNAKRHVLAGLLRCSACGKTLKARPEKHTRRGKRYTYISYHCKVYSSGCRDGSSISERRALREITELVNARLAATEHWIDPHVSDDAESIDERISSLEAQVADARRALRRAEDRYETASDDMLARAMDRLRKREGSLRALEGELSDARRARVASLPSGRMGAPDAESLRRVLAGWEAFDATEKRAVLETVIDHAVLGPVRPGRRLHVVRAS